MKRVVVNRETWLRGEEDSLLFRPTDQKMCCLGFMCLQNGVPQEDMKNVFGPGTLAKWRSHIADKVPAVLLKHSEYPPYTLTDLGWSSNFARKAMEINDNPHYEPEQRETLLKDLFRANGIDLIFVNDEMEYAYHTRLSGDVEESGGSL
jgi:hypothetical protein